MKKILVLIVFAGGFHFASAQTNDFELGIRSQEFEDLLLEFALPMSKKTRLHGNLDFADGIGVSVLYDWQIAVSNDKNMIFYYGVGGRTFLGDPFSLAVVGEIGLEYRFDIPLTVGIDYRPDLELVESDGGFDGYFGLNARFRF